MHELLNKLLAHAPVILDGGWGTQLHSRGLAVGDCPEAWNLDCPDRVAAVARVYAEAGARIVLTNSFGGSRLMLARYGLAERTEEINRRAAELSKQAVPEPTLVFGSMGPSGVMLIMGDVPEEDVYSAFAQQARALAAGGADGLVIETMSDPGEAKLAITAARETGLPVVACMVFDAGKYRDRTMTGATPEAAAEVLLEAGADVIGANCGVGVEAFTPICSRLFAVAGAPVWIKANAGMPEMVNGAATYTQTPEEFASHVPDLLETGAGFIGGCCGTNPDFIRAIAKAAGR